MRAQLGRLLGRLKLVIVSGQVVLCTIFDLPEIFILAPGAKLLLAFYLRGLRAQPGSHVGFPSRGCPRASSGEVAGEVVRRKFARFVLAESREDNLSEYRFMTRTQNSRRLFFYKK